MVAEGSSRRGEILVERGNERIVKTSYHEFRLMRRDSDFPDAWRYAKPAADDLLRCVLHGDSGGVFPEHRAVSTMSPPTSADDRLDVRVALSQERTGRVVISPWASMGSLRWSTAGDVAFSVTSEHSLLGTITRLLDYDNATDAPIVIEILLAWQATRLLAVS